MKGSILRPLAIVAVLFVIGSAIYLMMQPGVDAPVIGENEPDTPGVEIYDSNTYGMSFTYPDTYALTERDAEGSALRAHHIITLMDKEAAARIPANGEGPTTITIDVYGNGQDKQSVEQWVKNTSASNFKLSIDQKLATTTVAGMQGLSYVWDGLYRGESTAIAHKDDIVVFTVTSIASTDTIRDDFASILSSVKFR